MHFKHKIRERVYLLYLNSVPLEYIAIELKLRPQDVDEIIDYMNEIYII
jgi:hypothetical protein